MRKIIFVLAAVLGLLATSGSQAAIVLNFAAKTGSTIKFVGTGTQSTFNLNPQSNPQFHVTSVNNGTGDGVGATGSILSSTGFTFTQAGITTTGTGPSQTQSASLTGSGTLTLTKGSETVTGTITGVDITTRGAIGGTNTFGTVNLSNLALSGTGNSDLTTFYNDALAYGGIASVSFQFSPPKSLTQLTAKGTYSTSYSGSITTATPEPGTMALAFSGLSLVGLASRRRGRSKRA